MEERFLELLGSRWLIERSVVLSYVPLFISWLNGGKIDATNLFNEKQKIKARVIRAGDDPINPVESWDLTNTSIPDNSVAIIPIDGVIYSWKTMEIRNMLFHAENNPKIISILFLVNSPGGNVFYLDICAKAIKDGLKPSVAAIMNMSASAAYWLTSAVDFRICTSKMDSVGSIGVMMTIADTAVLMKEKLGINIIDLYATKSTRKNEAYRKFLEDNTNTALITKELDFCNEIFHEDIIANLGIKSDSEVLQGALYYAEEGMGLGLIDEINTLEYALEYTYNLGLANKINQFSKQFKL